MVTCLLLRITCRFPSLDYLAIALPLGQVCYVWVPGVLGRCELRSRHLFFGMCEAVQLDSLSHNNINARYALSQVYGIGKRHTYDSISLLCFVFCQSWQALLWCRNYTIHNFTSFCKLFVLVRQPIHWSPYIKHPI